MHIQSINMWGMWLESVYIIMAIKLLFVEFGPNFGSEAIETCSQNLNIEKWWHEKFLSGALPHKKHQ